MIGGFVVVLLFIWALILGVTALEKEVRELRNTLASGTNPRVTDRGIPQVLGTGASLGRSP
jgi:hypothetical protein